MGRSRRSAADDGPAPVILRLFAAARVAAGRGRDTFDPAVVPTLDALLTAATNRYGADFATVLAAARVWVNDDEPSAGADTRLRSGDEVAVLPPVSGGSDAGADEGFPIERPVLLPSPDPCGPSFHARRGVARSCSRWC